MRLNTYIDNVVDSTNCCASGKRVRIDFASVIRGCIDEIEGDIYRLQKVRDSDIHMKMVSPSGEDYPGMTLRILDLEGGEEIISREREKINEKVRGLIRESNAMKYALEVFSKHWGDYRVVAGKVVEMETDYYDY